MKKIVMSAIIGLSVLSSSALAKGRQDMHIGSSQQSVLTKDLSMFTVGWGGQIVTKNHILFGVAVDYQYWNSEIGTGNTKEDVWGIATDFKLGYQVLNNLSLYGVGGLQYHKFKGQYSAAIGFGGGAGVEYAITENILINMEYKSYSMETTSDIKYTSSGASANLKYRF